MYYKDFDSENPPRNIKILEFNSGIPAEDFDTSYINMIVCADTLIQYSTTKKNEVVLHGIQIKNDLYLYKKVDGTYFRTTAMSSPLDSVSAHDLKEVQGNKKYNHSYTSSRDITYKIYIDSDSAFNQHRYSGFFPNVFSPKGNINYIEESLYKSIKEYKFIEDPTLVCKEYIPEFSNNRTQDVVALSDLDPYKNDSLLNNTYIPDHQLLLSDSTAINLKSVLSKVNLIDFTASWCGPCRMENRFIPAILDHFSDESLKVISISLDESYDGFLKSIPEGKDRSNNWIQLWDNEEFKSELSKYFSLSAIPRFVIVDQYGKILDQNSIRPSDTRIKEHLEGFLRK